MIQDYAVELIERRTGCRYLSIGDGAELSFPTIQQITQCGHAGSPFDVGRERFVDDGRQVLLPKMLRLLNHALIHRHRNLTFCHMMIVSPQAGSHGVDTSGAWPHGK